MNNIDKQLTCPHCQSLRLTYISDIKLDFQDNYYCNNCNKFFSVNKLQYIIINDNDDHWYIINSCDAELFDMRLLNNEDIDDLIIEHINGSVSRVSFNNYIIN